MELQKMLERINFEKDIKELNVDLLNDLCASFISNVFFDSLGISDGRRRNMNLLDFYENIVVKKRGGLCCEVNGLLHWMLSEIGFKVDFLMGNTFNFRIGEFSTFGDHTVILVNLESGEKMLVDAGWGGTSFLYPLRLEIDVDQNQDSGLFRIRKDGEWFIVEKRKQVQLYADGKVVESQQSGKAANIISKHVINPDWNILYRFTLEVHQLEDFQEGFNYALTKQPFITKNSAVVRQHTGGRMFLIGRTFVEKRYVDAMTIKLISVHEYEEDELPEILASKFGISLDFEYTPITDRHWKSI